MFQTRNNSLGLAAPRIIFVASCLLMNTLVD